MTDASLLAFGCAVSFIALSGVYFWARTGMRPETEEEGSANAEPERA